MHLKPQLFQSLKITVAVADTLAVRHNCRRSAVPVARCRLPCDTAATRLQQRSQAAHHLRHARPLLRLPRPALLQQCAERIQAAKCGCVGAGQRLPRRHLQPLARHHLGANLGLEGMGADVLNVAAGEVELASI